MQNVLYYGDNLEVLRENIHAETVDLVYLDPPFNSNATYNVLFKSPTGDGANAQIQAFEDTWHWGFEAVAAYEAVLSSRTEAANMLAAMRSFLGENDMMAYLSMMALRLIELRRVLKPNGSLYLHCDPTASHYLKILLDGLFGAKNFRSEIIWKRTSAHSSAKRWGPVHDTIFMYSRSATYCWNKVFQPYDDQYIEAFFDQQDKDGRRWVRGDLTGAGTRNGETGAVWRGIDITEKGRHWARPPRELEDLDLKGKIHWPKKKGGMPRLKRYLDEQPGMLVQDVITDIRPMHNLTRERLGYPTQKPLSLLERIISASSKPGDLVLDPFCGCGTAIDASHRLEREWIGIDVTHLAIQVIEDRMDREHNGYKPPVIGRPTTLEDAYNLAARSRHQFELWAVWLVKGWPTANGKKGADRGIDGWVHIKLGRDETVKAAVSVKSGENIGPAVVRDLIGAQQNGQAPIGVLVTLKDPTKAMVEAASSAGFYKTTNFIIPRVQIITIKALLEGRRAYDAPHFTTATGRDEARKASRPTKERSRDRRQQEILFPIPGDAKEPPGQSEEVSPQVLDDVPYYMRVWRRTAR